MGQQVGISIFIIISAYDPDPLDPQDFGFLDPDPQKYAKPRIQGVKYQPKTTKKTFLLLKPKSELNIFSFLNGSSSFRIKLVIINYNKVKFFMYLTLTKLAFAV